jgi:peptidyl-prolyl cis-trans isomerase SurA
MKLFKLLFSFVILACAVPSNAQIKKVLADKIVATVGDKFILKSDVENAAADYKRQYQGQENLTPPSNCSIIEGQLIRKALVLQAQKDSLNVTEEEVENAIDGRIRNFIQQFGSKESLEEIAGRSIMQLKEDFRSQIREQRLSEQMQEKIVDKIKITPNEVRAFYNSINVDSLPLYESEVQIINLVMHPKANRDVEEYVIQQMLGYRKQIESGINTFDQLVKLYSEDPSAKENLGLFNLNRNEKNFDPAFMAGSFRLKEGQISAPIKSKFGYHIIQLLSRSGDDAVVKHILRIPPITNDEIKETKLILDSIRKDITTGKMSFGEAVNKNSDDDGSKFSGGAVTGRDGSTYVNIDQLDKEMVVLIKNMKPGDISQPQVYLDDRGRKAVRLVYFKERSEPHKENLKEDYNKIAQRALEIKKTKALETWFKVHVPSYFIFIDPAYQACPELKDWNRVASEMATEKVY